jgi:uncharacterized membrane protein
MSENENSAVTISPVASHRLDWLDAVRGLAVLGMLETHAVNAFLAPDWRSGAGFGWLAFGNGLVAPAFLWIAGYAHGLRSKRPLDTGKPRRFPLKSARRLVIIAALGYMMHLPRANDAGSWRTFWSVDILQCLAVSIALIVAIEWLAARFLPARYQSAVALGGVCGLGAAAIALAPLAQSWRTGWWPIDAYVDTSGESLFPLLPWFGFAAAGWVSSRFMFRVWLMAALGIIGCLFPHPDTFSKTHPAFFVERLGWLMVMVAGIFLACQRARAPGWLLLAGRESLTVYISHLVVIYWLPLASRFGGKQPPLVVAAIFLAVCLISLSLAWLNQLRKSKTPSTKVA